MTYFHMLFGLEKLKSLIKIDLNISGNTDAGIIGVDIGSSAIKVVELHKKDGVPTLDTYGELQLGPYDNTDVGKVVTGLKLQRQVEALVDILRESGVTGNRAALSIPYTASFTTTVQIDTIDDEEIAKRIPVVARKYVPVSLNEVTLDWFALSQNAEKNTTELLLVAIHNEALERLRSILEGAGLSIAYTELEPFSTIRSSATQIEKPSAFIDFGAGTTKLYIIEKGTVIKAHSIPSGSASITDIYMKATGKTFEQAEEMKRTVGLSEEGETASAVKEVKDKLFRALRELDQVIDAVEKEKQIVIDTVSLVGGGSLLPGIQGHVQDILQRKTVVANPFSKVAYPAFLEDTFKEIGPSFAVALGSALRSFSNEV